MLLFNRYGIKVFAEILPDHTAGRGPGRLPAERAAVRRLLREAFPDTPGITLGHKESGAPFLTGPDDCHGPGRTTLPLPEISVTHCRKMAAVATGPHGMRLGIDCESDDRLVTLGRVATHFLSEGQRERWAEPYASLRAWCVKEAAYKAAGQQGLPLTSIPLPPEIPWMETSDGSVIDISGTRYNVVEIDTQDRSVAMMLVFSFFRIPGQVCNNGIGYNLDALSPRLSN